MWCRSLQLSSTIVGEYNIQYPKLVTSISSSFSFVNVSIFTFVTLGCSASSVDQFDILLLQTLVPIGAVALCLIYYHI